MRSVRIATAFYLAVALPALIFGRLLRVAPLPHRCAPSDGIVGLVNTYVPPTSGESCRAIDYSLLYWLTPCLAIFVIGVGIALARQPLSQVQR